MNVVVEILLHEGYHIITNNSLPSKETAVYLLKEHCLVKCSDHLQCREYEIFYKSKINFCEIEPYHNFCKENHLQRCIGSTQADKI